MSSTPYLIGKILEDSPEPDSKLQYALPLYQDYFPARPALLLRVGTL